jgi:hypothetical protein
MSPQVSCSSSPTRIPDASRTRSGSRYFDGRSRWTARTCSAIGGLISGRSSCGSFTALSRTGFGTTPAKSNTIANVTSVFRIDSRASSASARSLANSATSAGVISSTRRVPRRVRIRPRLTPYVAAVPSATSIREVRQRSATPANVGEAVRASRSRTSGTRIAASSPASQLRRDTASRIVRKEPPCFGVDSRPPSR